MQYVVFSRSPVWVLKNDSTRSGARVTGVACARDGISVLTAAAAPNPEERPPGQKGPRSFVVSHGHNLQAEGRAAAVQQKG